MSVPHKGKRLPRHRAHKRKPKPKKVWNSYSEPVTEPEQPVEKGFFAKLLVKLKKIFK